MNTIDGGAAFPISIPGCGDNGASGMTLRDYFAAAALPAVIGPGVGLSGWQSDAAWKSYSIADAMLLERAKAEGSRI